MKQKIRSFIKSHRRDCLLGLAVLFLLLGSAAALYFRRQVGDKSQVVVSFQGTEILRTDLNKDQKYIIEDGTARETDVHTDLASLGEEAYPSNHNVNLLTIQDGTVYMSESNCPGLVCVSMEPLSSEAYDIPIVCLPHGLLITIETS